MKKSLFLTKESNIMLARIIASAALLAGGIFAPFPALWRNIICGASYLIIGYDVLCRAMQHVFRGAVFDENFLMSVATIGALCISQFPEAVAVMLFYQIGELLQDTAVHRMRREIKSLMDIRPDFANLLRNGATVRIALDDVMPGDLIVIRPGERVPLDCVVEDGSGALDTSALTGESVPRSVSVGDELMSGCLNQSGVLTARAIRPSAQSTASRILDLVETSTEKKAKFENFITKFARIYTPIVVFSALA
ncbi:MAG: heavy metal translocating P-type ATPase, partial [Clostridia bacterium]